MLNRFMIGAATAALIAGTSLAFAQGNMGHEGGAGGAGMQQGAPSSHSAGGATNREGSPGMKSSQSEEKSGAANRSAQKETKGAEKGTVGQSAGERSAQESKGEKSKSMSSENEKSSATKNNARAEEQERNGKMKAEGREERNGNMKADGREDRNGNTKAEGRNNNSNANTAEQGRSEQGRTQTTGQAGAGAKLSTEQRTKITTIIRGEHVAPVNNVNFAVSVGTRVPRDIGFHPLPADIVTIYPEWRGYEFFLVRDEIVVVDPRTLEIVAVLPA